MTRESRKLDHVRLVTALTPDPASDFDAIQMIHQSFPECRYTDCRLATRVAGVTFQSPLYINAMTGGAESVGSINHDLAEVARATGMAMAVGSQRAGINNPDVLDTYRIVRTINPDGVVIANLGAGCTLEDAKRAVEMIGANLLQLHLNAPQELVMPEGDRSFVGLLESVRKVADAVGVPVIVKEVGFGMCKETFEHLNGVAHAIDVSGRGGTNFIRVEDLRREHEEYAHLKNWGQTTAISLLEAQPFIESTDILASGGIRNTLDVIKSLALGARAVGLAGLVLRTLQTTGVAGTVQLMLEWHEQLRAMMTMLGATNLRQLGRVPLVVSGEVRNWCELRGIDIRALANR